MTLEASTEAEDLWRCRLDPAPFWRLSEEILGFAGPFPLAAILQPLSHRHSGVLGSLVGAVGATPLVLEGLGARLEGSDFEGTELHAASRLNPTSGGATASLVLTNFNGDPVASAALHLIQARPADAAARREPSARPPPDGARRMRVTVGQIDRYADASGDRNPLHTDLPFCTALGLPERVVHGSLLATLAQAAAGADIGTALSMRFLAPCFAGEELALVASAKGDGGRVVIHGDDGRMAAVMDWRPVA